jgi:hypothetical protein
VDTRRGVPERPSGGPSPPEKLARLLAELENLRRAGLFTEEQYEDERRRVERDAGVPAEGDPPGD